MSIKQVVAVFIACGFMLLSTLSPAHAILYKWEDHRGRWHIVDSIEKVPEKFRGRALPAGQNDRLNKKPKFFKSRLLSWPIDCIPGDDCRLGFPDIDNDGRTPYGERPMYRGHQGTDIMISFDQMDDGVDVFAAADGVVKFVFDDPDRFDRCKSPRTHPDCSIPGGTDVSTGYGPYCRTGGEQLGKCYWDFGGGNVVVILHPQMKDVFGTRYDHFKSGSITVTPGQRIKAGQKIGEVGSAGRSTGPHLHFEVWGPGGYYLHGPVVDPWDGSGIPGRKKSLWARHPPWK